MPPGPIRASSTNWMFRSTRLARPISSRSTRSARASRARGAIPNTNPVTRTRTASPTAANRSSRRRFRAARIQPNRRALMAGRSWRDTRRAGARRSFVARPEPAAPPHGRELAADDDDRHREQHDREQPGRGDRLPRHDDDRRRDGGDARLGERRERQDEPGKEDAETDACEQPDEQQERALERQPDGQLADRKSVV